jgi:uncharacterized protein (DUF885 family)
VITRRAALVSAAALAGCAVAPPATDASAQLHRLLADSDEAELKRNPIRRLFRGDFSDLAGDARYLSDAWIDGERRAANDELRRLRGIDRAALGPVDRIAYDTFAWERASEAQRYEPALVAVWAPLKLEHHSSWHLFFPQLSSGSGAAPYREVAQYDAGLQRIDHFVASLDRGVARAREGAARGVMQPRVVVERLVAQFDDFARQDLDRSPYYGPIRLLPAALPERERERLTRAYAAAVRERLAPAFARARDAFRDDVLPRARTAVGLSAVPGGAEYYRYLAADSTTTSLTPEAIHRIGVEEVERIGAAMDAVRRQVGFAGSRAQWFDELRSAPRFRPVSAQALGDGYRAIGERVQSALPRLFATLPKTPLDIRPTPDYQAPTDAAARYFGGAPDGSRPGVFFYNAHNLPSRSTYVMETLYLHEALPGHHLQNSLMIENAALPPLLRFGGNTAYNEGWALYAESLGSELGLYTDPYQRFGTLDHEMLRALRLVVDTGLHALGWTRERAIDHMLARSSMSRGEVVAEVERYIANPAQALAYKVGQLTIARLRKQAAWALGPSFDVREFHRQVLDTGSLPMSVLESKVDGWVAAQR